MNLYRQMFIALVLAASIVLSSAHRSKRQSCNDGRLCQCRSVLSSADYRGAQRRTKCLTSLGIQHDFQPGAQGTITAQTCETYANYPITGAAFTKCVFEEVGLISNINGVDQWNLPLMRSVFIEDRIEGLKNPPLWLRTIIVTTYTVCNADSTNFEVFPFDDCWDRARRLILTILEDSRRTSSLQNLAADVEGSTAISNPSNKAISFTQEQLDNTKEFDAYSLV